MLVCEQTRPLEPVQVAPGAALPEVFRGTKYWGNCVEVVNLALLKVYKAVESQIVEINQSRGSDRTLAPPKTNCRAGIGLG